MKQCKLVLPSCGPVDGKLETRFTELRTASHFAEILAR